jgi:hypothetical protein
MTLSSDAGIITDFTDLSNELAGTVEHAAANIMAVHARRHRVQRDRLAGQPNLDLTIGAGR